MSNFATLKKSSESLNRLAKEIEKINAPATGSERTEDTRFWQPEIDKAGNGMAVIRFLPAPAVDGDDALPWVRLWRHSFQGPTGKWYIENSLTTLGNQKDPVGELNSQLWNASSDDNSPQRKQARAQKRQLVYISNVLVISDPKNPENEGKVFLYRFGKKIFDKITAAMNPEFEGDTPVNPFDFWKGANFRLKVKNVAGYRNYDDSSFGNASPLNEDDAILEGIWKKEYSLKEFVDAKNFKSYDELKRRLDEVLGIGAMAVAQEARKASTPKIDENDDSIPFAMDEDDDLSMFKSLADD